MIGLSTRDHGMDVLTFLKLLEAFKRDFEFVRITERSRIVQDFDTQQRDDRHPEVVLIESNTLLDNDEETPMWVVRFCFEILLFAKVFVSCSFNVAAREKMREL